MPSVVVKAVFYIARAYAVVKTYAAGALLLKIGGAALLSTLTSKLFGPKVPSSLGLSDIQVTTRGALEHRKIVYGQAMVSGPIVYQNLAGTSGEYLWQVIALCDGLSDDLVSLYLDADEIPKADIAWTAGTGVSDGTGTGDVSTAKWVGDNSTKAIRAFYYLGDDAQPACGVLDTAFADWTTAHRLRGVTYLVTRFLYDEDTENVWKGGLPSNVKVLLKGRPIYDPRLDTTNGGTGTHRYATPSTWEWSENPALCVADYLMSVMDVDPATSIDWTAIADAADDCEVAVDIPTATTEDRFTCNGVLSLGSTHKDNLEALLSSCDGRLGYTGGVWRLRASVWEASSFTITADDLAGDVIVRGSAPEAERINTVRGAFIDPARNYEATEFPHAIDSAYVTRDNGQTISYDLQLPMTNTETMAQRLAFRQLQQGDNQQVAELKLKLSGAKIAVGSVGSVTIDELGWSAKTFRCVDWSRNADSSFSVVLREDSAASYTDPAEVDYSATNTGGVTIPGEVIPAPSGLTATGVAGGIELAWTNPAAALYDFIDIYEDTDSGWTGATRIARVRADTFLVPRASGTDYYYWIRAIRLPDLESLRNPNSDTTTITAQATGGAGNSVFFASVYIRSASAPTEPTTDDGSYNFATQTLTPPSGWSVTPPASDGNPLYVSNGIFEAASGGTDNTVDWTAPALLVSDGTDGAVGTDGNSVYYASIFRRNATAPATPTGGSYNFTTQTLTPPTLWSDEPPTTDGNPLWVCTAVAEIAGTTGIDSTLTWTAPAELVSDGTDGTDGSDGMPGLPGAGKICLFDDADTGISSTSAGKYGFGTSTTVGVLTWATIVNGTSIIYFMVPNLSTGSTENYEDYYKTIVSGDVLTWYDNDAFPGRWVSWRITGVGVAITGGYRFPVEFITAFDNGDTNDVPGAAANDVEVRFSRADVPGGGVGIGDIGDVAVTVPDGVGDTTGSFRVDSDGDYYRDLDGAGYGSQGTWDDGSSANTKYEVRLSKISGATPTGSAVGSWLVPSSDRTWTITRPSGAGSGTTESVCQVTYRRASDNVVLATQTVEFAITII